MSIINNIKRVKNANIRDIISIIPMCIGALVMPFFKEKNKNTWMISDRRDEASDNGFFFFKYMNEIHPEIDSVYVIDKKSDDYRKVRELGTVISYGGLKHWILYFTCRYNISSQGGHPNSYLCTFLEQAGIKKKVNTVFLQHGITKDAASYLFADRRKFRFFVAGAKPEYSYIKDTFGYPSGVVQYTGFARFDNLHTNRTNRKQILVMPTWRAWLKLRTERVKDLETDISNSEYLNRWMSFLNSPDLRRIADKYNLQIVFFPHSNFQIYLDKFASQNSRVTIASKRDYDVQELMITSALLITDYSSVFFDMAYMKKPIIFYQFDEEEYRAYHYQQGWFDYHSTSFGNVCKTEEELMRSLESMINHNYKVSDLFISEHKETFPLFDTKNCDRIYNLLRG